MNNSMDWTISQALKEVGDIPENKSPDCMLIIALWNSNGNFDSKFWNVGMKTSEMIALLEVQKQKLMKYMEKETEQ